MGHSLKMPYYIVKSLFLTEVLTAANYLMCLAKYGYCIMLHIFKGDILIGITFDSAWYAKLVLWCPYSLLLILSQDDSIYFILILLTSLDWRLGLVGWVFRDSVFCLGALGLLVLGPII